jgi:hypothetical protein
MLVSLICLKPYAQHTVRPSLLEDRKAAADMKQTKSIQKADTEAAADNKTSLTCRSPQGGTPASCGQTAGGPVSQRPRRTSQSVRNLCNSRLKAMPAAEAEHTCRECLQQ